MRGTELLYKMELIDPVFLEEAEAAPQRARSKRLMWGSLAACFFLLVGIFAAVRSGAFPNIQAGKPGASATPGQAPFDVAYSLRLEGNETIVYDPIDFEDCLRYGLVPQNAAGLDRPLKITEADIGEFMGTVTGCYDPALNGCKAYHYARYPEKDAICIIDTPRGYAFYSCRYLYYDAAVGASSDELFSLYGLPDSLEKMEVLTPGDRFLFEISDPAQIAAVIDTLSGKTNIGLAASNRRYAEAWYDAYGNEDVFFNEEQGCDEFTDVETYEEAHALWGRGCRHIRITTEKGFQLLIDYVPAVCSFNAQDSYYVLSEEETEALNAILQITD